MKLNEVINDMKWRGVGRHKGVMQRSITATQKAELERKAAQRKVDAKKAAKERRDEKNYGKPRKFTSEELWQIARIIEDAVGQAVPDGDPIDYIAPKIERRYGDPYGDRPYNMMDALNAAVKIHLGYKGYYDYLAEMWDAYHEASKTYPAPKLDLHSLHDDPLKGPRPKEEEEPEDDWVNPWR